MSCRLATRRLRRTRSIASLPMRVSATAFSVIWASMHAEAVARDDALGRLATRVSASS